MLRSENALQRGVWFTQIGEPVPEGVTLKNVIDTFPPEVSDDNISVLSHKDFVGLCRIGCYEIAGVCDNWVVFRNFITLNVGSMYKIYTQFLQALPSLSILFLFHLGG